MIAIWILWWQHFSFFQIIIRFELWYRVLFLGFLLFFAFYRLLFELGFFFASVFLPALLVNCGYRAFLVFKTFLLLFLFWFNFSIWLN